MSLRIGQGLDVHAFAAGDHVVLGGVRIPHERGLAGHSDGDVLLHAVADALLGALGEGDLGRHFPSSDASLADLLEVAAEAVNVKVTSTDGLGSLGRGEGIAAQAVALLVEAGSTR